jgi:hypothetical protein
VIGDRDFTVSLPFLYRFLFFNCQGAKDAKGTGQNRRQFSGLGRLENRPTGMFDMSWFVAVLTHANSTRCGFRQAALQLAPHSPTRLYHFFTVS